MSGYDHESSIMRRPWPTGGCKGMVQKCQRLIGGSAASDGQMRHFVVVPLMTET